MTNPPLLVQPKRLSTPAPSRIRPADDFFIYLEPSTVVDALALPGGVLRSSLVGASAAERDYAMRTALASQKIWEWLNELSGWNWPRQSGPDGFEKPSDTRRKLFVRATTADADTDRKEYMGSLLVEEVVRYERRISEIHQEMDDLALEEIKGHIMNDHILPLSRPGTPIITDPNRSMLSALTSYHKMEDVSVLLTAIVVQTLPNLAKLTRLLQLWTLRITVLQRVPLFLQAIQDAEVLLGESWEAISQSRWEMARPTRELAIKRQFPWPRKEFESKKQVLALKVADPGRALDYMLDCLEGCPDTLPEDWLNRMEDVEQGYSEWVAACERMLAEAGWATIVEARQAILSPPLGKERQLADDEMSQAGSFQGVDLRSSTFSPPILVKPTDIERPSKKEPDNGVYLETIAETDSSSEIHAPSENDSSPFLSSVNQDSIGDVDGANDHGVTLAHPEQAGSKMESNNASDQEQPGGAEIDLSSPEDVSVMDDNASLVDEEGEIELPPLRSSVRRDSFASQNSTIVHNTSRFFDELSSDLPEVSASPIVPKSRLREAFYPEVDEEDDSPPSSPPEDSRRIRGQPTALDSPMISPIPEDDESFLKSPFDISFLDDFDDSFATDMAGPTSGTSFRRESMGDQRLREQISHIIESIPAKIRLTTGPSTINLNPPDLQLPRLRKMPSREPIKRSASGLSQRTVTPSFTLSPAKSTRQRTRGQQPIKVYHLSRSDGDAPIKLFIRCVGEHGERVMVRVGGGWADLAEYLKEYASHHGRRSAGKEKAKVEVRDLQRNSSMPLNSSPPSRPPSGAGDRSSMSPLAVRKTRRSTGAINNESSNLSRPKTPVSGTLATEDTPPSDGSNRSRPNSRLSWVEDESSFLGLAGPRSKKIEMSEESKAWVESVKEKVRLVSGERRVATGGEDKGKFGDLGKVGGTTRVFRKA